jgi:hypothetical protein
MLMPLSHQYSIIDITDDHWRLIHPSTCDIVLMICRTNVGWCMSSAWCTLAKTIRRVELEGRAEYVYACTREDGQL